MISGSKGPSGFRFVRLEGALWKSGVDQGAGCSVGSASAIYEDGKRVQCAIKVAENQAGRIHFVYDNGQWVTLSEVDRILYVRRSPERPGQFEVQMHSKETLIKAFNQNRRAAEKGGFTNLPAWLSPDLETAPRFTGSGFGGDALWRAVSSEEEQEVSDDEPRISVVDEIERAKVGLAGRLGIDVDEIEIRDDDLGGRGMLPPPLNRFASGRAWGISAARFLTKSAQMTAPKHRGPIPALRTDKGSRRPARDV